MTTRHKLPPAGSQGPARQLFDAISSLQSLSGDGDGGGAKGDRRKIALSRLHAYAASGDGGADPELERILDSEPAVRRDFRRLLGKTASVYMPRVAAASSGEISQRVGGNCRIRFEPSRAEPEQVYVIIEFTVGEGGLPATLFVCDDDDHCDKFPLPRGRDGVIQLLLERESELLAKLRDINTEIYLG
jgi:hypothetical protein